MSEPLARRATLAGAGAAALLGALGLAGWVTPWPALSRMYPGSIPMAPSTALALVSAGAAVILEVRRPSPARTSALSLLVTLFAGVQLATFVLGLPPAIDAFLAPSAGTFAGVPTGRIAPLTALGLFLAGLSMLALGFAPRHRLLGGAGAGLALTVCLLGAVLTLGYLFGAPLLYGGTVIPVAFSTALAITCLGAALVALAPRDSAPLRPFLGPTIGATLLRAFLPVAPMTIGLGLLFGQVEGLSPAVHAALATLVSAAVISAFVSYAARAVGRELDRSQRDAARLAAIVESSEDAIYTESLDGTITAWNASAERLFGYSPDEVLGRSTGLLLAPRSEDEWRDILARIHAGERIAHQERHHRRKDGTRVLVSLSESPLHDAQGRVTGVSVIARDVSEQRRAEQALAENEKALRAFFESSVAGILFGDSNGALVANDEFLRITGYTRDDLVAGRVAWETITPPEFQARDEEARREARERGACTPYEKQYFRKDGTRVWVLVSYALLDRGSERSVGFVIDIDARKQIENDLRRSEERFAKVFESNLIAIGIGGLQSGRLLDVNARYAEFFGYAREEMIGRTVGELGLWADPADRDRFVAARSEPGPAPPREAVFRRKSGETCHALLSMEAITLSGVEEPLAIAVLVDLTGHKRLELQLLQAQKMEAVGRLAGGIAHDFNNVLSVILGCAELMERDVSPTQRSKLDQIEKAAERAAGLTRQLLAFSRKQIVEPKVVDLNVLLADLEKMLGHVIGEDVDLAIVPGADLGYVKADPGQLEQVVMNLCVNARDAMDEGGLLRLETANVEIEPGDAARHPLMAAGRYVMLSASDTGCGIDAETLPKIFEPFFTTKEKGKGTGLGLATVYGIVKQAGGFVWAYSEVGRGTTFKIYLPRIDDPATPPADRERPAPRGGSETILLVEDEVSLREITHEILAEHGYQVIDAGEPNEALEASRRHLGPIHLLLTDVVMPGASGRHLADALTAARPALKVLYMSGYTDDIIAHRGVLTPGTHLLSKPFTGLDLLRRVREALGDSDTGGQG